MLMWHSLINLFRGGNMQAFDQGTIIYGLRSEKYPDQACYGVVISARCDIANCKIRRLYYLIAVEVTEWLVSDEGFEMAIGSSRNGARNSFCQAAENQGLNWRDLLSFDPEQVRSVIQAEIKGKQSTTLLEKYQRYCAYQCADKSERRKKLKEEKGKIRDFLKAVNSGDYTHLYYLPEVAYRDNGIKSKGLIVDLQKIEAISIADMQAICDNKVDSLILDANSAEHYSHFCWIEDKDCYTGLDGLISSPWCEHLMQRFANSFVRIGIDGATPEDFGQLVSAM